MIPASVPSSVQWAAKVAVFAVAALLAYEGKLNTDAAELCAAALVALGVTNAATLIASGNRIVSLVHHVASSDAANVIAAITSLPPPPLAPPPAPPPMPMPPPVPIGTVVGCFVVAAFVGGLAALHGCGGALLTPADQSATNDEQDQQMACIKKTPTDAHAISVCRAGVRADWDRYWAKEFEAGKGDAP